MGSESIIEVDLKDEYQRQRLIDYLLPHETHSLFLIANLKDISFPSHYYVAEKEGEILGVCAYYPVFKSFSLFTKDTTISREFARFVAKKHEIKTLLGMESVAKEAFEEFLNLGYVSMNDPKHVFMELDLRDFQFFDSEEGVIKLTQEKDFDQVVLLNRLLHHQTLEDSITDEERNKIALSDVKFCLEIEDRIVCSAISNGIVNKAFQILGVITHPEYRKRGFAKAVCSHLIRYLQKNEGAEKAVIFTDYSNSPAINCYKALGFKITNEYYFAQFSPHLT